MKRDGHIYLVGFSGSGKSTLGPRLARRLRRPFEDSDTRVEKRERRSIARIFADKGERYFRSVERDVLASLARSRTSTVIALGGGVPVATNNRRLLSKTGVTVYLKCSRRELYRRLRATADRPLLTHSHGPGQTPAQALRARIDVMLKTRLPYYESCDLVVSTTNRSLAETVDTLMQKLRMLHEDD